jgi:hypothetical protein
MILYVVYLLLIFKIVHGLMNNQFRNPFFPEIPSFNKGDFVEVSLDDESSS